MDNSKCHWCQDYYFNNGKQKLCSYCLRLYHTGEYTHDYQLRSNKDKKSYKLATPPRNLPTTLLKRLMSTDYTEACQKKSNMFIPTFKMVNNSTTIFTPSSLYKHLDENQVWVTSTEASKLLNIIRQYNEPAKWEHAICCRVIDHWNLRVEEHGIGECYYNIPNNYPTGLDQVDVPSGRVFDILFIS